MTREEYKMIQYKRMKENEDRDDPVKVINSDGSVCFTIDRKDFSIKWRKAAGPWFFHKDYHQLFLFFSNIFICDDVTISTSQWSLLKHLAVRK